MDADDVESFHWTVERVQRTWRLRLTTSLFIRFASFFVVDEQIEKKKKLEEDCKMRIAKCSVIAITLLCFLLLPISTAGRLCCDPQCRSKRLCVKFMDVCVCVHVCATGCKNVKTTGFFSFLRSKTRTSSSNSKAGPEGWG